MESRVLNVCAVVFDVYGTLLEVGPPPADAADQWEFLWEDTLADPARLRLEEFSAACDQVIAREHAAARQRGIPFPEVYWPAVAAEVLPEIARLGESERDEFLFRQARLWHTVRLAAGAADLLRAMREGGLPLGLASNAQAYTVRELQEALAAHELTPDCFEPSLCFWSFEHGFSKPDPHVFRLLSARMAARGLIPGEVLMVGDRLDNDIEPARAQGWQTWHLTKEADEDGSGDWRALRQKL